MIKNKVIIRLFEKAGDIGPQPNLIKIIKTKFNAMDFNEFKTLFMEAMFSVFVSVTPMHCSVVNNMIKFAAHSLSVLTQFNSKDGCSGMYLLTDFFRKCLQRIQSKSKIIRWRFCLFLNHLLNSMSSETVLSVELCDVAITILLGRLKDINAEVRVQAVHALHRLQLPDNPKCKIVKKFMFHMTSDPCVEVRASIVKEIAMFKIVVEEILKYTLNDVNESVRKEAHNRFLDYPFDQLSPKQRQEIVVYGLKDPSTNINSFIKKQLLVKWLENCNNDFETLLKHMDLENVSVCEQIVNILFESIYDSQVLELTNKFLNSESRLIDFNQLTVEKIFLWKCIGKYLTFEKKIQLANTEGQASDDYIEVLLPDLVKFSDYIREYFFNYNAIEDKEFILLQLLDFVSIFVMDDVGAASLNKLCYNLILYSETSMKIIQPITMLLNLTIKSGPDILNYSKNILNEIQTQTVNVLPLIDKVGTKMFLENQIKVKTMQIKDILETESDSEELRMLIIELNKMKKELDIINNMLTDDDKILVEEAVNILLKGFELVFQVQQLIKVSNERSLVTDIIQNIVIDYLECSLVTIRMDALHCIAPYLLVNNLDTAKVHIFTLFREISRPMTNKHLLLQILFELLLTYGLKSFDISDDIDADHDYDDDFTVENILPLLADSVDYEVNDRSFKSVIVEGFCNLIVFKKVESINVISKFLIIWFKRLTHETFNVYHILMKCFTTYMFNIHSSSSTIAKCYVPIFKQIEEHKLIEKLGIDLDEMNTTLINLCQGIIFKDEKMANNAHGELAGYILDYLLDEDQPYTTILVNTLHKLQIDFECENELLKKTLIPKLKRVIKHMKSDKNRIKYLKKIKQKFDSILQKESHIRKRNDSEVNPKETHVEQPKPTLFNCTDEPSSSAIHGDLFSQEHLEHTSLGSDNDEESGDQCRNLSAMKRMSEVYKRSFNTKHDQSSSESE
ncbi:Armadillo-type fold,Armadillo-like helical,Nuclear condensin complex subunit 3, C-terminal [Cinara cedri]|uniref:Armadillo-type fold,Armadillo-like helical,Nuclear condensin complex subunit 3, C-terminal n=1 Tax=Cinara cedri TaxID=506608 RepID=A0A5E4MGC1_9HEMI|nr:Armadillo-type fold,Armadillo-like helical,Nuclear condensin complex subunit 3, C-terminal [Cinara cedri]